MDLSFIFENRFLIVIASAILAIFYGTFLTFRVLSAPKGDKKMNDISDAISEGAAAYMKRQYTVVAIIGMSVAVRSNIRTAQAAKTGLPSAFSMAFKGGAVTGLMVAGLALLSVVGFYWYLQTYDPGNLNPLIALSFGGSLISVFARLGGGIFTKSADVGTDMVGKIEKG